MKALVIYYSLEGSCEFIAQKLKESDPEVTLLRLKPEKDVPDHGFMKFFYGGMQVVRKRIPPLLPYSVDLSAYDLIVFGTPVWAGSFAPAIYSFLNENKLEGKKVALFCTYGGSAGKTFDNLREELKENSIVGEIEFKKPIKNDTEMQGKTAQKWLSDLIQNNL